MDTALEYFNQKLENVPDMPKYNHCAAALNEAKGDYKSAKDHYVVAMLNDPKNVMIRNDYALHVARRGDIAHSTAEFKRALLLNPDQPTIHKNMGAIHARKGQYKESYEHARRAIQINSSDPMSYRNIAKIQDVTGDTLSSLNNNLKAIKLEQDLPEQKRNSEVYRIAAVQMVTQGKNQQEALNLMRQARVIENRKYISPTTERTNEIIEGILSRTGNELENVERELRRRREMQETRRRLVEEGMPPYQPKRILW